MSTRQNHQPGIKPAREQIHDITSNDSLWWLKCIAPTWTHKGKTKQSEADPFPSPRCGVIKIKQSFYVQLRVPSWVHDSTAGLWQQVTLVSHTSMEEIALLKEVRCPSGQQHLRAKTDPTNHNFS